MEWYSMEQFEIMGDILEEMRDWERFEEDLESDPWGTEVPDLDAMEEEFRRG